MPAPETSIEIMQRLAEFTGHEWDCPASYSAQDCTCGLYELLRRTSNVCQIIRAEVDATNAVADSLEIDGIGGLIAQTHFEQMEHSLVCLRKQVEGGKTEAPTDGRGSAEDE